MTSLREAVDRIALVREATQFGSIEAEPEYKTFDTLAGAARTLLAILDASEEVSWCEVHDDYVQPDWGRCLTRRAQSAELRMLDPDVDMHACSIVSARLLPSSLLAGPGET